MWCGLRRVGLVLLLTLAEGFSGCSGGKQGDEEDAIGDAGRDVAEVTGREGCPDGLVWWEEHGVCAPQVAQCEAWEVPLVGGGCMPVGPRACPRTWDPDAAAGCEPGELMDYDGEPCPEGFVLTEDEIACIPFFEEDGVCDENEIPVLGGGCIQIGPRACPKLWDPDAEIDCEVGDVLPCPEGWEEGEDGMYCDPGYAACGPGERTPIGGGCERVIPLEADCPPGPYPEVAGGAANVVYVNASSACEQGCGSEQAPYPSIQAAVYAVPEGGHVLVAAGVYDEGLLIEKPVHVVGVCAAKVTLTGLTEISFGEVAGLLFGTVVVLDTKDASVSGLRVASPGVGVTIWGAQNIALGSLELSGVVGAGMTVGADSTVTAQGLWVHDLVASDVVSGMDGRGIWVQGAAELSITESLVESAGRTGIYVSGKGTVLEMTGTVVRETHLSGSEPAGNGEGVEIGNEAIATITGSLLESNALVGLRVYGSGAHVDLTGTVVRQNGWAGGMEVGGGATATIRNCLLEGNPSDGVKVYDPDTHVALSGTVVRQTKPDADGERGVGMEVGGGATATIQGCLLQGNTVYGLITGEPGTEVVLAGTVVRDTEQTASGMQGYGVAVIEGAAATLDTCLLQENTGLGIGVGDPDSRVELARTVVRGTKESENDVNDATGGAGMLVIDATATVSGSLFDGNTGTGIAADSGAGLEITDSVVRDTQPNMNGEHGTGMLVGIEGTVSVSGCLFERNTVGVAVFHPGTQVEVSGSVVRDMRVSATNSGWGMVALDGGVATLSGCLIDANTKVGVGVTGPGTRMHIAGSLVCDTKANTDGVLGIGMAVVEGARAVVLASLLCRNYTSGLAAWNEGTKVEFSGGAVMYTRPGGVSVGDDFQVCGDAVTVAEGAFVDLASSVLAGNGRTGVYYHQSTGRLRNSIIVNNDSYGLAMYECDESIEYEDGDLFVLGNAEPQTNPSPMGLPLPPQPDFPEFPGT